MVFICVVVLLEGVGLVQVVSKWSMLDGISSDFCSIKKCL